MSNYLYSVTVSNASNKTMNRLLASMPPRYYNAQLDAEKIASCVGAPDPRAKSRGSVEIYFSTDSANANALRKWMKRRFKGRSKFSRQVVPTQFCSCVAE